MRSNGQILPISNDNAFCNLIVADHTVLFLSKGELIQLSDGKRSVLSNGPISCFRVLNNQIYYLTINEAGESTIIEMLLDGSAPRTVFSCSGALQPSGYFTIGNQAIYFFVGDTGMWKIDILSGEATDLSKYFTQIENLGIIRSGIYQNGNLYFLGQVFYDLFDRPSFLYKLDLSDGTISKLADTNTTHDTLDANHLYFSSGGKIFQMDEKTCTVTLLQEGVSPSAMEIVHDVLFINEGGEYSSDYLQIKMDGKGAIPSS